MLDVFCMTIGLLIVATIFLIGIFYFIFAIKEKYTHLLSSRFLRLLP